ncbi:MAG TPA: FG-GAP-like repeat-containing protein [Polyangiaceae bacterium]|nr:FG-GAP-like repeat-containing protein [Polyangiaceae bacterium]
MSARRSPASLVAAALACAAAGCSPSNAVPPDAGARPVDLATANDRAPGVDNGPTPPMKLPGQPSTLGPAFTDITADIAAATSLQFPPPSPTNLMWTADISYGVIGDLDGDGKPELVVSHIYSMPDEPGEVYTFDPATSHFTRRSDIPIPMGEKVAALVDLDDDGNLDLLMNAEYSEIAWGLGGGRFSQPMSLAGGTNSGPSFSSVYFDDVDGDGWLDVLTSHGCCDGSCPNLSPQLREGPRLFVAHDKMVTEQTHVTAWTAFSATFATGEKVLLPLGLNCDPMSAEFYHQTGRDPQGYPAFSAFDPTGMSFPLTTLGPPMGAALADLDGDGLPDLTLSLQYTHVMLQGQPAWPFQPRTNDTGFAEVAADAGHAMIPWGTALLDVDLDGRPDAINVHGDDDAAFAARPSNPIYVGPQFVTVHWNGGGFRFGDITKETHLDRRGEWMTLVVGDLDSDGDPDLVVGGQVELLRVYRNDVQTGNHGLSLRLHGTSSNHLGIGARVDLAAAGLPVQHLVMAPNSCRMAAGEALLFAGLGTATQADSVRITWPSGMVQEVTNLAAGKLHTIEEPPLFAIAPATRQLPPDGRSVATVRVTPRTPDGTLRTDAQVAASIVAGGGTLSSIARDANGWSFTVTAPTSAGSTVLEIAVDGQPTPLHPRLFWR